MNEYNIGTEIRIQATFRNNLTGELSDPDQVFFVVYHHPPHTVGGLSGSGTWTYGIDSEVIRDSVGQYFMNFLPPPHSHFYSYKAYSTGNFYAASNDGNFFVR